MEYARQRRIRLDAVAVSSGPGSSTGLRIGVSEAKGLSYGLGIPLIAVPTARIMASMMKDNGDALLCPMIDARRMEVYATFFDRSLNVIRETSADVVGEGSYDDLLEEREILFFGNGAEKCRSVITHPNARFIENVHPLASGMIPLAEKAFADKAFVDVAYFEPFYLKEFVETIPKNKVIGLKS
jgi:tRNA threonylcarbamoyladenosine biosynthesis protein TsaB